MCEACREMIDRLSICGTHPEVLRVANAKQNGSSVSVWWGEAVRAR